MQHLLDGFLFPRTTLATGWPLREVEFFRAIGHWLPLAIVANEGVAGLFEHQVASRRSVYIVPGVGWEKRNAEWLGSEPAAHALCSEQGDEKRLRFRSRNAWRICVQYG